MMHCMVNCRQMVGQKKAGLIQESLLSGLATLIPADQLQSPKKHPNQRFSATPEDSSDITFGKENAPVVNWTASEKIENGARRWDRNVGSTLRTGPLLHKGSQLGNGKRHSPYRKVADVREARRASLDRKSEVKNSERMFRKPAICSSTILSFRDDRRVITVPEELMADDTTGKFAYISLDGRLINGELATSTKSIGGGLGQQEAQVWEGFAPMQRVLVVAVAAAVAAAAKHKNSKEIDRLLKTVQEKDNEILSMRQQLNLTCTQSTTSPSVLALRKEQTKLTPLAATTVSRSTSPMAAAEHRNTKEIERHLKTVHEKDNEILSMRQQLSLTCKQSIITPSVLTLREEQTKLTPLAATTESRFFSPIGSMRSCSEMDDMDSKLLDFTVIPEAQNVNSEELPDASVINKGVVLVETPSRGDVGGIGLSLQHEEASNEAEEAAKWYVNPMVLEAEDQYFDMCTPERGNPLFAACTPAVRGSLEWMALRSSFKNRDSITSTPVPQLLPFAEFPFVSPAQMIATCDTKERCLSPKVEEDVAKLHQDLTASRVLCASVILDLKKELVAALDTEVSRFRAAVLAGLEEGTDPVEGMHLALARCWQDITPKALSDLGLSPSEFESYQLHHKLKGNRNLDNILKLEEGIQAWREYMKAHCPTDVSIRQPTNGETPTKLRRHSIDVSSSSQDVVWEDFQKLRATVLSASGAEVKITACIASPDRGGPRKSITFSAKSGHQGFGFPKNSAEYVAEQLLGELDKAAAQVAEMEIQMKRLEQSVAEADAKRQEAEKKLIASTTQDLENQARLLKANADKTKELRLREVEIAELESRHKIMLVAKNNEIVTLRGDCNQRDTLLHESEAAVQPTITANTERIAVLEDVCRGKDSTIYELKQEILALETKLHAFRTFQSPAMLRGRRSFMPFATPPVNDYTTAINGLHKQEPFKEIPTPPFLAPSNPVHQVFEDLQTRPSTRSNQDRDDHSLQVQTFEQGIYEFKHDSPRDNYSQLVSSSTNELSSGLKHSLKVVSVDPAHHQCLQKGPKKELYADKNECSSHSISNTQQAKAMDDDDDDDDDKRNDQCKPKSTRNTLSSMQASPSRDGSSGLEDCEDVAIEFSALKQSLEDVSVDPLHQCLEGPKEEHYANKNECSNHAVSNTQQVKAMDDDKHNDQWKPKSTRNALSSMQATSPSRDGSSGIEQSGEEGGAIEFSALKQLLAAVSVDPLHQCLEGPKKEHYANKNECSNHAVSNTQQVKAMDDDKHNDQWKPKSTRNALSSMQATSPSRDGFSGIEQSGEEGGAIEFSALKQLLAAVSVDPLHQCLEGPKKEHYANKNECSNHSIINTQQAKAMDDDKHDDQWKPKSKRTALRSMQATSPSRDGSSGIEQSGEEGGAIEFSALKQSLEAVSVDPLHQCLEGPKKEDYANKNEGSNHSISNTQQAKAMDDDKHNDQWNPKSTRSDLSSMQATSPSRDGSSGIENLGEEGGEIEFSALKQSLQAVSVHPLYQFLEGPHKEPLMDNTLFCNYSSSDIHQSEAIDDGRSNQEFKPTSTRNNLSSLQESANRDGSSGIEQSGEEGGEIEFSALKQSLKAVSVDPLHQCLEGPHKEPVMDNTQFCNYSSSDTHQSKAMDDGRSNQEFKPKSTRNNLSSLQELASRDDFSGLEQSCQAVSVELSALKHSLEDISVDPQESTTKKNQNSEYCNMQQSKAVDDDRSNQEFKPKRSRNDFSGHEQSCQDISRLSPLQAVAVQHFEGPKREPLTKKNQYSNYSVRNTQQSKVMDHNSVADFKLNSTRDILNARDSLQVSSSKDGFSGLEQLSPPEHSTEAVHSVHHHLGGPKKEALTNKNQYNSYAASKKQQFKVMSYKSSEQFKPKSTRDNWSSLQLLSSSRDGFPKLEQSHQAVLVDKESSSECGHCVPENTVKPSAFNHVLSKQPKAPIEVCRVSTSSLNSTSNLNRVRASVTFTSSTKTMETSRAKASRASNKSTNNAKRMDGKKNSRTSPGSVGVKVLGSVAPNTPIKNRNASSMDLKGGINSLGGGDPGSKENSATKRRRWV